MGNCKDCIYWGKQKRTDTYQVCYRPWADGYMFRAEDGFFDGFPNVVYHQSSPIVTKPEFGCVQFEGKDAS